MAWHDQAEQGFPPQRHREPITLRKDILDELTDHLALAAERESESGVDDEQQIRKRVLKKFGNPAAIARALWWGAMKETIMKDWIQISINAIICISVVGFMALFYRQMQTTNTALINALNDRPSAAEVTLPSVEFFLHRGSIEGPPAEGIEVNLRGKAFNEDNTDLKETSDGQGHVRFGPIRAGQYTAGLIDSKTGLVNGKKVTLYSNDEILTIHVPVPPITQTSVEVKSVLAQHAASEDIQLSMFLQPRWSCMDDTWQGPGRFVLITPDGVFNTELYQKRGDIIRPKEKLTQIYGNRLQFNSMNVRRSHYPDESGIEWFKRVDKEDDPYYSAYSGAFNSYDLEPDEPNSIVLDLPDALLSALRYHVRLSANSKHGLPDRFGWFLAPVSEEFTDFVIDEARFVQYSLFLEWSSGQGRYNPQHGGGNETITDKSGQLFALRNAPKSLPEGYKLFLGFRLTIRNLRDLGLVDANLCAYLDTAPMPIHNDRASHSSRLQLASDPIWKLNANSIDANESEFYFVDLTDEVKNSNSFGDASGILFKWDIPSRNSLRIVSPENDYNQNKQQPVWLIMKPIANGSPSDSNDD